MLSKSGILVYDHNGVDITNRIWSPAGTPLCHNRRFYHIEINMSISTVDGTTLFTTEDLGRPIACKCGVGQLPDKIEEILSAVSMNQAVVALVPAKEVYAGKGIPGLIPPDIDLIYRLEIVYCQFAQRAQRVPSTDDFVCS